MTFEEWERGVPQEIKGDTVWRIEAYRLALFAADIGWRDVVVLSKDRKTWGVADQLYRSLGAVSADVEEGYSRGTGKDRARFYEYGLGSARESRGWYYKGRYVLGDEVANHRIRLMTHVIKLLLTMIPQQRGRVVRESQVEYLAKEPACNDLTDILTNIPLTPESP